MHMHGEDDPWVEFRKRREEWRAQRQARREAWRERRRQRHAEWGNWGEWGVYPADWGMAPVRPDDTAALKAQVADMQKTIDRLLDRVAVLEKLAVDGDETRLAAEIEKLRGMGPKTWT